MTEEKVQINFQTSSEDVLAIDKLAALDGYDNRSAWVRFHLRQVINARRAEITTAITPSRATNAQPVPLIPHYDQNSRQGSELNAAEPAQGH
jgi:hypothetical protein